MGVRTSLPLPLAPSCTYTRSLLRVSTFYSTRTRRSRPHPLSLKGDLTSSVFSNPTSRKNVRAFFAFLYHKPDLAETYFHDAVNDQALANLGLRLPGFLRLRLLDACRRSFEVREEFSLQQVEWRIATMDNVITTLLESSENAKGKPLQRTTQHFSDVVQLTGDCALTSEALYLSAHRVWNSRDMDSVLLPLAKYMLGLALHMGNLKAALDLAHMANRDGSIAPPAAMKEIRTAALDRTDWRAMTIYTRYLLNLQKEANQDSRKLAFDLARELSASTEPAFPGAAIQLTETSTQKWEAPWMLLRDAALQRLEMDHPSPSDPAHQEINQVFVSALRQGVDLYNDPDACRTLSDHPAILEFSPEWIDLKTKSAMTGHSESCFNLARYYLEYYGWYPCIGKSPSNAPMAQIGLTWLRLSADSALDNAKEMGDRYTMLALLLRENGLRKEGHDMIKRGIVAIETFSTDSKRRRFVVQDLQSFDRSWEHNFPHRVERMLGEPKLSSEQRYQGSSTSGSGVLAWLGMR